MKDFQESVSAVIMSCHERFLLNSITDIAYEIDNGKLIKGELNEDVSAECDCLVFDISKLDASDIENMERQDFFKAVFSKNTDENKPYVIKMVAERGRSNDLIKYMLDNGAELREMMNCENI